MESRFLRTDDAARFCGVSPRTLEALRIKGGGPRYLKPTTRLVVYDPEDLMEWLRRDRRSSTSEPGSKPPAAGGAGSQRKASQGRSARA